LNSPGPTAAARGLTLTGNAFANNIGGSAGNDTLVGGARL
jgi:hypothetical protein